MTRLIRLAYIAAAVVGWVFVIPAWFYFGCPL